MNILPQLSRVLLADDHAAMLAQTRRLLTGAFEIVGSVDNGLELLNVVERLDPDVVVLDITMPGMDGIEAAREMQRAGRRAKLVFLSVHDDLDYVRTALDAGASAYVVKARMASDLVTAIRESLAAHRFLSPTIRLPENL